MRIVALSIALALAACGPKSKPEPTTPPETSVLSDDGTHVRAERVYEGECMPEGSRGGCHTVTLRPDGTFDNFLFDAMINGTYEIHDHTLVLTLTDGTGMEEMTFSDDYSQLGELPLKP
jgi:hypothetical protein